MAHGWVMYLYNINIYSIYSTKSILFNFIALIIDLTNILYHRM